MNAVAVLTPEQVEQLVRKVVREEIDRVAKAAAEPSEILTREQAAELLAVNAHQIPKLIRQGMPAHRFGAKGTLWRFRRSEILQWVANRKGG